MYISKPSNFFFIIFSDRGMRTRLGAFNARMQMALYNRDNYGVESKETNFSEEKMRIVSTTVLGGLSHNITAQLESCVIMHTDLNYVINSGLEGARSGYS